MHNIILTFFAIILLFPTKGISQNVSENKNKRIKIGIQGFKQRNFFKSTNNNLVPIYTDVMEFSGGASLAYQKEKNSLELSLTGFPYRANVAYTPISRSKMNPITLKLWSLYYQRTLLDVKKIGLQFNLGAGIGISHYKYQYVSQGPLTVKQTPSSTTNPNDTLIFISQENRGSDYKNSLIVLPRLKFEIEKIIFKKMIFSIFFQYTFRNIINYNTPLEKETFDYRYNNNKTSITGSGQVNQYGNNFQTGLSLKYFINLK